MIISEIPTLTSLEVLDLYDEGVEMIYKNTFKGEHFEYGYFLIQKDIRALKNFKTGTYYMCGDRGVFLKGLTEEKALEILKEYRDIQGTYCY